MPLGEPGENQPTHQPGTADDEYPHADLPEVTADARPASSASSRFRGADATPGRGRFRRGRDRRRPQTHIGRIFTKPDLRDRAQAVTFAYETGPVTVGADRKRR
ncbi:hypothetical protein GCM10009872_00970 [Actinopolymorpha rutila]